MIRDSSFTTLMSSKPTFRHIAFRHGRLLQTSQRTHIKNHSTVSLSSTRTRLPCRASVQSGITSTFCLSTSSKESGVQYGARLQNMTTPLTREITLTENARRIRALLLDARSSGDQKAWSNIELRFAGGCVRDMLLGIDSNDIDVAISTATGFEVATLFQTYLSNSSNLTKHGLSTADIGRTYKVEANPEKSKHLETATMSVIGVDLDFVNLRKEVYAEDSRTPSMEFATAEEDAFRRDAKINALFYNLHTERVEDFVGGLKDLDDGIISTPLEPKKTFVDDPLRVLRLIRFASRLGFRIKENTRRVMADEDVLGALKKKISRERVGIEFDKMMKAHDPRSSLALIDSLGLYHTIFTDDIEPTIPPLQIIPPSSLPTTTWSNAYDTLQSLLHSSTYRPLRTYLQIAPSDTSKAWLLAALTPLHAAPPNPPTKRKPEPPYAARVARSGIKQPNKLVSLIQGCINNSPSIMSMKHAFTNDKTSFEHRKDEIGMAIRSWEERGGEWKLQVLWCILVESLSLPLQPQNSTDMEIPSLNPILEEWTRFLAHLDEIDILDAATRPRIVDGKMLQKELGVKRLGPWMKGALDVCMAYQFRNPHLVDGKGAIEEVRGRAKELGVPIE